MGLKIKGINLGEGRPEIVMSVFGKTEEEIFEFAGGEDIKQADIVEWRADSFEQLKDKNAVYKVLMGLRGLFPGKALLFTFRTINEGGDHYITGPQYEELIYEVIDSELFDIVDVELFTGRKVVEEVVEKAHAKGIYVLVSNHDIRTTPSKADLVNRSDVMAYLKADMIKLAVTPRGSYDLITLADVTYTIKQKYPDIPRMTMGMGKLGLISRLTGEIYGSDATYGAGQKYAPPGQLPFKDLKFILDVIHDNL